MKITSVTKIQLIQKLTYDLFKQVILSIEGIKLPGEDGMPEEFISKSDILEGMIEFLNLLGDTLGDDIDLQEVLNAANLEQSEQIPSKSEENK